MIADSPRVGDELGGRYRVTAACAQGEAPVAVRAKRLADDAEVLLFVAPRSTLVPQGVQRYAHHARPLRGLMHPRLLMVLDEGLDAGGSPWLATSYWDRETVALRLARQRVINSHVATAVALDVLSALQDLHDRGLPHRGVGAGDVLLVLGDDGALHGHLLAGGVLRALACGPRFDDDAARAASWAPEQWHGDPGGPTADVWAVGVLLHRMLTGELPFAGTDARALAASAETAPHAGLGRVSLRAVQPVIDRALGKRPGDRFADARAMRLALQEALAEAGIAGSRVSAAPSPVPPPANPRDHETDADLDALIVSAHSPEGGAEVPTAEVRPTAPTPAPGFDLDSLPVPPGPSIEAAVPKAPALPNIPVAPSLTPPKIGEPVSPEPAGMQPIIVHRPSGHHRRPSPVRPAIGSGAAIAVVLAATLTAVYFSRDFLRRIVLPPRGTPPELEVPSEPPAEPSVAAPRVDGGEELPTLSPPRVESQSPQVFGEQLRVPLPPGLSALQRTQFVIHIAVAAAPEPGLRGFASCVDGRVFLHPGGVDGALREGRVATRCEGVDLALVGDLDGDGLPDIAAIDVRRSGVVVIGSRRMRETGTIPVPGAWALGAGLVLGEGRRREPAVAVYTVLEGTVPSLVAVGLRSGRIGWRSDPSLHVGAPADHGLAVMPDLDGDDRADLALGIVREGQRCVTVLSGATGQALWRAPRCGPRGGMQRLSTGADANDDGHADLALAETGGRQVTVLSGRDGAELSRVPLTEVPTPRVLGPGLLLAPDLGGDGFADLAAITFDEAVAALEVYSANDGHRVSTIPINAAAAAFAGSPPGVQYVEGFAFARSRSLLLATTEGVVVYGGAAGAVEPTGQP